MAQINSIFKDAWQEARDSAARFGGKTSDYFYGPEGALQNTWDAVTGYDKAAEAERQRLAREIVVPLSALPAISYSQLKARARRLVTESGSSKFWVLNKGGRSGWDGLDVADYRNWTDGDDVMVSEALTQDLAPFLPSGSEYDDELEHIVYTAKLDRFRVLGGNDADIELS